MELGVWGIGEGWRGVSVEAAVAAEWWTARLEQGDKQAFYLVLVDAIVAELARDGKVKLEVDYDPNDLLLGAVHATCVEGGSAGGSVTH